MTTTTEQRPMDSARKTWVGAIALLLRNKRLILLTTIVVTAGAAIYLFGFAKSWYKSEANVVPARKSGGGLLESLGSGISSTIKDLGITPIAGKNKGEGYSPLALIASREIQEKLVREFGFMKIYDEKTMGDAIKEFGTHVSADVLEEGNISIGFEDTDPVRAANVANRLVEELNSVNSKLGIEEAKFNRTYIEQRYSKLLSDLDSSEQALDAFQKKYGVYELKTQAQAQLTALGLLEQQEYATDIQLKDAEQLYGSEAAETNMLRANLEELRSKLEGLKTGMDKNASSYFVPMDVMPDVALQYLRLTREVEIQSKLKAYMLPTYEQAKLDETRQVLTYLVLDRALPPEKKSRPKRSFQLIIAMLGSFAITSLAIIGVSNFQRARERYYAEKKLMGLS